MSNRQSLFAAALLAAAATFPCLAHAEPQSAVESIEQAGDLGARTDCPADIDGNGILEVWDVFQLLQWFIEGDIRGDYLADGIIDVKDIFVFLADYAQGFD